jgi:amino acid transporter
MIAGSDEGGGLARGVVGSARTIAFGTSIVAPSASAATVLVLVVAYAGFASPLVVLITFAGSLCCALSTGQFAGRLLVIVLAGLSFVLAAVNAAIRVMYTMGRERALPGSLGRLSHRRTPVAAIGCLAAITLLIGLPLTYVYGGVPTFGYPAGIGGLPVVLIYLAVNIAVIRAFRTEFRHEFRPVPHLLIPAAASVVFLFPLWGILFPGAYTLANLLPFISLGWLLIGAIAAGILRARRPATFQALGRAVAPNLERQDKQLEPD